MSVQSKRIRGVLLCLVLACVVALVAGCDSDNSDDENAIVTGTVADQTTLDNVAGITVQVGDARSAVTGTSGEFTLGPAPDGAQTVLAYGTGYSTARIAKTLAPGNNNVGTIYLREGPKSGKGDVAGTVVPYSARLINATVTGGGGPVASGTVQFSDGGTNLGSVALAADGTATLTTSALTAGTHAIEAEFDAAGGATVNAREQVRQGYQSIAMVFRLSAMRSLGSVRCWMSAAVIPSTTSMSSSPLGVTSMTARSVMIR